MKRLLVYGLCLGMVIGGGDVLAGGSSRMPTMTISGATQVVKVEQLRRVLKKELSARIDPERIALSVQVLFPKKAIEVPKGSLVLKVAKDRFGNLTGRRAFRVQLLVDNDLIKTISVVTNVTASTDVITPIRWIKFKEVVQSNDLAKATVKLRKLNQTLVWRETDVVGKQATRSLPPDQPIQLSYVTNPPLVHKGDQVMIEVRRGGLFIQTIGVAKASGQSGEFIPVKNQASGREVLAMIVSPGIVEVNF